MRNDSVWGNERRTLLTKGIEITGTVRVEKIETPAIYLRMVTEYYAWQDTYYDS